jgi:hypothetical protein
MRDDHGVRELRVCVESGVSSTIGECTYAAAGAATGAGSAAIGACVSASGAVVGAGSAAIGACVSASGEVFAESSCTSGSCAGSTSADVGDATSPVEGVCSDSSDGISFTVAMLGDQRKFDLIANEIFVTQGATRLEPYVSAY